MFKILSFKGSHLLCSNFYFADNALIHFYYTYPENISVHFLRILLSSFGEEDFQRCALNLVCSNCFGYYFKDNVGAPPFQHNYICLLITYA